MYKIQMMTTMSLAVLLTACARATASDNSIAPASGSVTVTGRVVSSTGTPIPDARVYIPGAGEATRTDANGNYNLTGVPDGPQEVVVRHRGYAPTRVDAKFSTKRSDRERNHIAVKLLTQHEAVAGANQQSRDSAGLA